jgi:hypothetical protein
VKVLKWMRVPAEHGICRRPERDASQAYDVTDAELASVVFRADDTLIRSMVREAAWKTARNVAMAFHPASPSPMATDDESHEARIADYSEIILGHAAALCDAVLAVSRAR